jgi:hypothetical protein
MKKNLYTLMRRANMQGMTTTFHLEPDRLGPLVRKNAVLMLRHGFVHGRGNAATAALSAAEHVGIELPHNYYGDTITTFEQNIYTEDGTKQIVEKMRSCITGQLLSEDRDWRRDPLKEELASVDDCLTARKYLRFYGMSVPEVREFMMPHLRPAIKERLEHAAQMLLSSIPIHIETYRSN